MVQHIVVKDDLATFRQEILKCSKFLVSQDVDPLKNKIADVKQDVPGMRVRLEKVENRPQDNSATVDRETYDQIISEKAEKAITVREDAVASPG